MRRTKVRVVSEDVVYEISYSMLFRPITLLATAQYSGVAEIKLWLRGYSYRVRSRGSVCAQEALYVVGILFQSPRSGS